MAEHGILDVAADDARITAAKKSHEMGLKYAEFVAYVVEAEQVSVPDALTRKIFESCLTNVLDPLIKQRIDAGEDHLQGWESRLAAMRSMQHMVTLNNMTLEYGRLCSEYEEASKGENSFLRELAERHFKLHFRRFYEKADAAFTNLDYLKASLQRREAAGAGCDSRSLDNEILKLSAIVDQLDEDKSIASEILGEAGMLSLMRAARDEFGLTSEEWIDIARNKRAAPQMALSF